tara:strand:+ start:154 stop:372 length:219 start_codon:yes stop_codon:yes gene_type:complete
MSKQFPRLSLATRKLALKTIQNLSPIEIENMAADLVKISPYVALRLEFALGSSLQDYEDELVMKDFDNKENI